MLRLDKQDRPLFLIWAFSIALFAMLALTGFSSAQGTNPGVSPGKAIDLTGGDKPPNMTIEGDEAAKKAAEEAAKKLAEKEKAAKEAAEKKKLEEANKRPPATPEKAAPAKPTAKAPCHRVAKRHAPKKARVKILSIKETKNSQINRLRDELAKQQQQTAVLRASGAAYRAGIEDGTKMASAALPRISIKNDGSVKVGDVTAKAVNKPTHGRSSQEDATATTTPGQPGSDKPEASKGAEGKVTPDPKAPAKGKGKTAETSGEQSLGQPRGVPVRFLIPKGMGKLGG